MYSVSEIGLQKRAFSLKKFTEQIVKNFHVSVNHEGGISGDETISTDVSSTDFRYAFEPYAESDSNVEWEAIQWQPKLTAIPILSSG